MPGQRVQPPSPQLDTKGCNTGWSHWPRTIETKHNKFNFVKDGNDDANQRLRCSNYHRKNNYPVCLPPCCRPDIILTSDFTTLP